MFSISQVAQMLGLGIDAVRFYEKKGLVHPQGQTGYGVCLL